MTQTLIVLLSTGRPDLLASAARALAAARTPPAPPVLVYAGGGRLGEAGEAAHEAATRLGDRATLAGPRFPEPAARAARNALAAAFKRAESVVFLPEDVRVCHDGVLWADDVLRRYRDDPRVFACCLYSPERFATANAFYAAIDEVRGHRLDAGAFTPWGFATWKDRWQVGRAAGGDWPACWVDAAWAGRPKYSAVVRPRVSRVGHVGFYEAPDTPAAATAAWLAGWHNPFTSDLARPGRPRWGPVPTAPAAGDDSGHACPADVAGRWAEFARTRSPCVVWGDESGLLTATLAAGVGRTVLAVGTFPDRDGFDTFKVARDNVELAGAGGRVELRHAESLRAFLDATPDHSLAAVAARLPPGPFLAKVAPGGLVLGHLGVWGLEQKPGSSPLTAE